MGIGPRHVSAKMAVYIAQTNVQTDILVEVSVVTGASTEARWHRSSLGHELACTSSDSHAQDLSKAFRLGRDSGHVHSPSVTRPILCKRKRQLDTYS
jgi:hypothetical protein